MPSTTTSSSSAAATTFAPYSRLPWELKIVIWGLSIEEDEALPIAITETSNGFVVLGLIPKFLKISKEVQILALATGKYLQYGTPGATQIPVFCLPGGRVFLTTTCVPRRYLAQNLGQYAVSRIERLELHADFILHTNLNWLVGNLRTLTSLTSLRISGSYTIVPGYTAPQNIFMTFETHIRDKSLWSGVPLSRPGHPHPPLFEPFCHANGMPQPGPAAFGAIFYRVTDPFEQQRYLRIMQIIDQVSRECTTLPLVISLFLKYQVFVWSNNPATGGMVPLENRAWDMDDVADGLTIIC